MSFINRRGLMNKEEKGRVFYCGHCMKKCRRYKTGQHSLKLGKELFRCSSCGNLMYKGQSSKWLVYSAR